MSVDQLPCQDHAHSSPPGIAHCSLCLANATLLQKKLKLEIGKSFTVNFGYNDSGCNDSLDVTTIQAGTGFAALKLHWV